MNIAQTLVNVAAALAVSTTANAGSLILGPLGHTPNGDAQYRIDWIELQLGIGLDYGGSGAGFALTNTAGTVVFSACGRYIGQWGTNCNRVPWPMSTFCATKSDAERELNQARNTILYVPASTASLAPKWAWRFQCDNGGGMVWQASGTLPNPDPTPPPASCTSSNSSITLTGNVGETVLGATTFMIQCDRKTDLKLSIANRGQVAISGGGQVQLKFKKNNGTALTINAKSTSIGLVGELTKSPTTAGTYRGSTVLSLDIL